MRAILYSILVVLSSAFCVSCDDNLVEITFFNNSKGAAYFTCVVSDDPSYVIKSKDFGSKNYFIKVEPSERLSFSKDEEQVSCEKIHFLVIKSTTMDKYDDKSFREAEDICDKRFVFTYNELKKKGFVIEFKNN